MGVGTNQARDLGIQVLAYAGEHDGHDVECPRCIAANLLAEVERLREDNVALRRAWRVDSDGQHETSVRLADERDRLREDNRLMQQVIDDAHGELDYLAPGTNGLEHDLIERLVSIRER